MCFHFVKCCQVTFTLIGTNVTLTNSGNFFVYDQILSIFKVILFVHDYLGLNERVLTKTQNNRQRALNLYTFFRVFYKNFGYQSKKRLLEDKFSSSRICFLYLTSKKNLDTFQVLICFMVLEISMLKVQIRPDMQFYLGIGHVSENKLLIRFCLECLYIHTYIICQNDRYKNNRRWSKYRF